MKTLEISKITHPQSGKPVDSIVVLGHEFVYSDKRGESQHSLINKEFALKIIATFDPKVTASGREVYMPHRLINEVVTLKWFYLRENEYELAIHDYGHVWTSSPIIIS